MENDNSKERLPLELPCDNCLITESEEINLADKTLTSSVRLQTVTDDPPVANVRRRPTDHDKDETEKCFRVMESQKEMPTVDDITANQQDIDNCEVPSPVELKSFNDAAVDLIAIRLDEDNLVELRRHIIHETVGGLRRVVADSKDEVHADEINSVDHGLQKLEECLIKRLERLPKKNSDDQNEQEKFQKSLDEVALLGLHSGSNFRELIQTWLNDWTQLIYAWIMQMLLFFDGESIDPSYTGANFELQMLAVGIAKRLLLGGPTTRSDTLKLLIIQKHN
jgi:hypothetical protein